MTDGAFVPAAAEAACDTPPAFLPARPITQVHLAALTERVRCRVIRWFRRSRLLAATAAADMLTWENSGFSVDAFRPDHAVPPQVRGYCQPLEHLLRYCARPPFALERLSVIAQTAAQPESATCCPDTKPPTGSARAARESPRDLWRTAS